MQNRSPNSSSKNLSEGSNSGGMSNVTVAGRYVLGSMIASGAFGEVFLGRDNKNGTEVAIKLEPTKAKVPQLAFEAKVLDNLQGTAGFAKLRHYGRQEDYNILIMDLLGPSVEDLFQFCGRRFSLKTTCLLGMQMMTRLEWMHNAGYLHRDVKPENFVMGLGKQSETVFIVDFGLAKRWKDPQSQQHIEYKEGRRLTGTARYCSINTHKTICQSRRDDIEALAYVLVYLLRGKLPWQGITAATKSQKYDKIGERKIGISEESLCEGLPSQFTSLVKCARSIKFTEKPDYSLIRGLLRAVIEEFNFTVDGNFDWIALNQKRKARESILSTASAAPQERGSEAGSDE
eukprot:GFYU01011942.1.p1 GENE.GFYU01011942.1~~GFYU01011942.1.p1  ORF type:complete len:345 (-),score=58.54 GFYU01011942.1:73-1107(-)